VQHALRGDEGLVGLRRQARVLQHLAAERQSHALASVPPLLENPVGAGALLRNGVAAHGGAVKLPEGWRGWAGISSWPSQRKWRRQWLALLWTYAFS
jgi:hypothetical protein